MKFYMKWFMAAMITIGFAAGSVAQLTDDASNYGGANPDWEDGANEGDGFGPWTLNWPDGEGGVFLGNSEELDEGVPQRDPDINTDGQAFGMWNGGGGATEAIRGFDTDVWGDGSELSFDFSFRFDNARGVTLHDSGLTEFAFFVLDSSGYQFPGTNAPMTEWPGEREDGEILTFTFTQNGPDLEWAVTGIRASSPDESGVIPNQTLAFFRIFNNSNEGGGGNDLFFNNLSVTEGTVPLLRFSDGVANPDELGPISLTLERTDEVVTGLTTLSSSNEDALTVPDDVTFNGDDEIQFVANVVSLLDGPATVLASNVASGAVATFTVIPAASTLSIDGPFNVFELGEQSYTLTRTGGVGDDIVFSSSDETVLTVPASASFPLGDNTLNFDADIVGFGFAQIIASNVASGAWADYGVNVLEPSLTISGPAAITEGQTRTYTVTRVGPVGDTVDLSSSNDAVVEVPASVTFVDSDSATFEAEALAVGSADLVASNVDATSAPFTVTVNEPPTGLVDIGANYDTENPWVDGSNGGAGFGTWAFNHTADPEGDPASFAGVFIGDPAAAEITGMDEESFGFFANPAGSGANAEVSRSFADPLGVGFTFSFQWGLNWDSNDENSNRGFNLIGDTNQLLNINMSNSAEISITPFGGAPEVMFENYGNQAFTLNFEHVSAGQLRVFGTGRDGSESFDETYTVPDLPDAFTFYFNATDSESDERQMYVNMLQITGEEPGPEGPTVSSFVMVNGDLAASIDGEEGMSYYLVYVTDLTTITSINPPVLSEWTIADSQEDLVADALVTLEDTDPADETRFYWILITDEPLN